MQRVLYLLISLAVHFKGGNHKAKQNIYRNTLFDSTPSCYRSLLDKRGEALGQVHRLSSAEYDGAAAQGLPWSERASKESWAEVESADFSIDTYTEALKAALSGINKPHPWCNMSTANTEVGRLPSAPSESCGGLGDVSFQIVSSAVRASAKGAACLF